MAEKKKNTETGNQSAKKSSATKIKKTTVSKETVTKVSTSKSKVNKPQSKDKNKVSIRKKGVSRKTLDETAVLKPIDKDYASNKAKARAVAKSRQATSKQKEITEKRKKKEATRVIPVDEILKAQAEAEREALKLREERKNNIKESTSKKKVKKTTTKNVKNKKRKLVLGKENKKNQSKLGTFSSNNLPPRIKKAFIVIVLLCLAILVFEGIYFLVYRHNSLKNTVYYDSLNSLTLDGTDIVAVGSSNFKYSKHNDYTEGLEKAKVIKYNNNGEIIFEKMYSDGINSTFNSIIEVKDGYVTVGSYEKDKKQAKDQLRDALIVKYDEDGEILWEKTFTSLSDTEFYKVIEVEDGYVAIGQSIYAPMEMGNSTEGGGVIIKYSTDGEIIWKSFHGGTKSARFNGIAEVNGDLYVVGRDGTDFGNLVKFSKDGEYKWHKNYRYTDTLGLSDISYSNDKLYVVGTKKIFDHEVSDDSKRDTTNTDAVLIQYDLNGEIKFEKTFGGSGLERYNSIMSYHDNLFVIGSSNSTDSGLRIFTDGTVTAGILVKYDLDGNIEKKKVYGGSNTDNLTAIVTDNSNLYITAYTNSKDGNIITSRDNGKDYFGRLIKVDSRLRILFSK